MPKSGNSNAEQHRQDEQYSATDPQPWSLWGPYLSERQWGTVREDYSPQGTAWEYFPHDHARRGGEGDRPFLERIFYKLMLNFTWWVNRKDAEGRNVFQGGFLELDNIGVFDRSAPFPTGGPGRWHELDGDVLAQSHAHRARIGAAQPRVRRCGD